jgi:hypothetical protein
MSISASSNASVGSSFGWALTLTSRIILGRVISSSLSESPRASPRRQQLARRALAVVEGGWHQLAPCAREACWPRLIVRNRIHAPRKIPGIITGMKIRLARRIPTQIGITGKKSNSPACSPYA